MSRKFNCQFGVGGGGGRWPIARGTEKEKKSGTRVTMGVGRFGGGNSFSGKNVEKPAGSNEEGKSTESRKKTAQNSRRGVPEKKKSVTEIFNEDVAKKKAPMTEGNTIRGEKRPSGGGHAGGFGIHRRGTTPFGSGKAGEERKFCVKKNKSNSLK